MLLTFFWFLYYMKDIDSILLCICSALGHRSCWSVARINNYWQWHTHFDVVYDQLLQHRIYLLNWHLTVFSRFTDLPSNCPATPSFPSSSGQGTWASQTSCSSRFVVFRHSSTCPSVCASASNIDICWTIELSGTAPCLSTCQDWFWQWGNVSKLSINWTWFAITLSSVIAWG